MPLKDGEYEKLTKEEIQRSLERNLNKELDTTAQPGDLVSAQLAAEAETLVQNQEEALQRIYQAAYLEDATGEDLDKVVDIIDLNRLEASSSTGVVRMWRESPPTSDYIIPRGSRVQTGGSDPIEYELTQSSKLAYIDGWESGNFNNWDGDVAEYDIVETDEMTEERALQVPATDGVDIFTEELYGIGTVFTTDLKVEDGSKTALRFGIQDQSNYLEAVINSNGGDLSIRLIEEDSVVRSNINNSADIPNNQNIYAEVRWGHYDDHQLTLYESNSRDTELSSITLGADREWPEGAFGIASYDGNATALLDEITTRSVLLNIRSIKPGTEGNLGPYTVNTIGDPITGIQSVTNPVAVGKPTIQDTNFSPLLVGENRETDEELRERAFNSNSIGGAATANALESQIREVKGVKALTLNRNREESTSDNGLPPHSFEAIVYGGADEEIAEAIFNTASIDSHDVGGINGNLAEYDIQSDVTNDTETISWTRPVRLNLDIELDLIVDDNYVGENEIKSIVVDYIGGTAIRGQFVEGLDPGDDIYEAVLKRKLVNPEETGVWEVDTLKIDANGDGTDDTETTASGADVLVVDNNEVAITNARDGSINITTNDK
jgi:uncharacterized phage protein gp47/JayE